MNQQLPSLFRAASRSGERGFTLVSAIFILVVLAVLGATIATVSSSQQRAAATDILGTRAYAAARAGLEWGMYQVNSSNGFSTTTSRSCPTPSTNNFTLPTSAPTLSGFTVTVTCTASTDPNNDNGPTVYQIDAVACNVPLSKACPGTLGINYVERRVRASL